MTDARFDEGAEAPLRLRAESPADLAVVSALVQDAVGRTDRISWSPRRHRFTLLLNRFRWEDAGAARRQDRPFERVQALLEIDAVLGVRTRELAPAGRRAALSLLSLEFEATQDAAGRLRMALAGGGEIALEVECLDVTLVDVTRPYLAQGAAPPRHDAG